MTLSIAFHRELALLFAAAVAIIIVVTTGQGLSAFMILNATAASAILLVGNIRNRRKLIYVGLAVGIVAALTTIGVETLPPNRGTRFGPMPCGLGCGRCSPGLLMTGLLPFIESMFGVQTEFSLLELGDVAHPLLQELVRRAPGTYNHSINVASIAEAAAESDRRQGPAGARGGLLPRHRQDAQAGLLRREPGARRQPPRVARARHEHADHHRPRQGRRRPGPAAPPAASRSSTSSSSTTARRWSSISIAAPASERANPDGGDVDESSFRYPGPKPQTKEAAVLMLADAVESASRTLVEPTPARIESLVHEIAMKRLLGRPVRRLRSDAAGTRHHRRQPDQVADRRLSRPHQVSRAAHGLSGPASCRYDTLQGHAVGRPPPSPTGWKLACSRSNYRTSNNCSRAMKTASSGRRPPCCATLAIGTVR